MIADWDIDTSQGHRKGKGARGIMGLIFMLKELGVLLSLPGQPDQSWSFTNVRFLPNLCDLYLYIR